MVSWPSPPRSHTNPTWRSRPLSNARSAAHRALTGAPRLDRPRRWRRRGASAGIGRETRGDKRGAIASFEQVVEFDPVHEEAYAHLMRLAAAEGERHIALRWYGRLLECLPMSGRDLTCAPGPVVQGHRRDVTGSWERIGHERNRAVRHSAGWVSTSPRQTPSHRCRRPSCSAGTIPSPSSRNRWRVSPCRSPPA
jgi:hypothetical protein